MPGKYPHQVLSRLSTKEEKQNAKNRAKANGISVSVMIRLLLLRAEREDWSLSTSRKQKAA